MKYLLLLAALSFCQWLRVGSGLTSQGWIINTGDRSAAFTWSAPDTTRSIVVTIDQPVLFLDYGFSSVLEGHDLPNGQIISSLGWKTGGPFVDRSTYLVWNNNSWDSALVFDSVKSYCVWIVAPNVIGVRYVRYEPYFGNREVEQFIRTDTGIYCVGPVAWAETLKVGVSAGSLLRCVNSDAGKLFYNGDGGGAHPSYQWFACGAMTYFWLRSGVTRQFQYMTSMGGLYTVALQAGIWTKLRCVAAQPQLTEILSGSVCPLPFVNGMMLAYRYTAAEKKQQTRIALSSGKTQLFSVDGRRVDRPVASGVMVQVKDGKAVKSVFVRGQN